MKINKKEFVFISQKQATIRLVKIVDDEEDDYDNDGYDDDDELIVVPSVGTL